MINFFITSSDRMIVKWSSDFQVIAKFENLVGNCDWRTLYLSFRRKWEKNLWWSCDVQFDFFLILSLSFTRKKKERQTTFEFWSFRLRQRVIFPILSK
jgi:hypothetical protein